MDNLWTRRSNSTKLQVTAGGSTTNGAPSAEQPSRSYSTARRNGDTSSHSTKNPFNIHPPSSASLASPTGASSAFGLGSGAFASFGAAKTPKTAGGALDFSNVIGSAKLSTSETKELSAKLSKTSLTDAKPSAPPQQAHMLRYNWVFWFRPPITKSHGFIEYEKTLHPVASFGTAEDFLHVYRHLKRPSTLPVVSDYHIFKKGIRPVWEDDENRKGGKWIVRLKKGIADRYWEDLVFAIIGDQFADASEVVCGAVLSVRNGEDILSIWARNDGGRVLKIRETMKRILGFPPETKVEWKSHDSSIQQRTAIDEHRKDKPNHHPHGTRNGHRAGEDFPSPSLDKKQVS